MLKEGVFESESRDCLIMEAGKECLKETVFADEKTMRIGLNHIREMRMNCKRTTTASEGRPKLRAKTTGVHFETRGASQRPVLHSDAEVTHTRVLRRNGSP